MSKCTHLSTLLENSFGLSDVVRARINDKAASIVKSLTQTQVQNCLISSDQTYFILDWDDTLLPSSFIHEMNLSTDKTVPLPSEVSQGLLNLDLQIVEFLTDLLKLGQILLISNGQDKWIRESSFKFLKKTHDFMFNSMAMMEGRIQVISARDLYESRFPKDPAQWKRLTFAEVIEEMIPACFFTGSYKKEIKCVSDATSKSFSPKREVVDFNSFNKWEDLHKREFSLEEELQGIPFGDAEDVLETFSVKECIASLNPSRKRSNSSDTPNSKRARLSSSESDQSSNLFPHSSNALNLISIGDNPFDCIALRELDLKLASTVRKTIKLNELTSMEEISEQLEILSNSIKAITYSKVDFDLAVKLRGIENEQLKKTENLPAALVEEEDEICF